MAFFDVRTASSQCRLKSASSVWTTSIGRANHLDRWRGGLGGIVANSRYSKYISLSSNKCSAASDAESGLSTTFHAVLPHVPGNIPKSFNMTRDPTKARFPGFNPFVVPLLCFCPLRTQEAFDKCVGAKRRLRFKNFRDTCKLQRYLYTCKIRSNRCPHSSFERCCVLWT